MDTEKLTTVSAVVKRLGGNRAVMALTGSKYGSAVSNWKKIGKFPAKTHKVLKGALQELSLDAPDELWEIILG